MGQSIMLPRKRGRKRSMRFRSLFWLIRQEAAYQVVLDYARRRGAWSPSREKAVRARVHLQARARRLVVFGADRPS